jgi:excinuclease ABC subunit B
MRNAMDETNRRRALQEKYNAEHGITPETIKKNIRAGIEEAVQAHRQANAAVGRADESTYITEEFITELEGEMYAAAKDLDFERAAALRDELRSLRELQIFR